MTTHVRNCSLRMCLLLLLYNIYWTVAEVNIYPQTMSHVHSGASMWTKVCKTPLFVLEYSEKYTEMLSNSYYIWCKTNYASRKIGNGILLYYCLTITVYLILLCTGGATSPTSPPPDVGCCQSHRVIYIYTSMSQSHENWPIGACIGCQHRTT